jgi:hypothetical protein
MTIAPSELAYTALLALLQSISGIGTVSRRLTDPSQVQPENGAALFINETGEHLEPTRGFEGLITKQMLTCDLYLFVSQQAPDAVVSTLINNMIYSIRTAIAPPSPSPYQTLGGTVSHCWIKGKVEIIEGVQDGQGMAIIPIEILTNY